MNLKKYFPYLGRGMLLSLSGLGLLWLWIILGICSAAMADQKEVSADKMISLSQELVKREEQIKQRELALQQKQDELDNNIKNFEARLKEFEEQQSKILGCLAEQDAQKNKRLDQLVTSIAAMRPQNAAAVLSVQDAEIAVRILDRLDPTQAAKIFNLMDKEISAGLQKQYLNMKK